MEMTLMNMNAEHTLLHSSDWPHWDIDPPARIMTIGGVTDAARDKILGRNANSCSGFTNCPSPHASPHPSRHKRQKKTGANS